MKAKTPILLLQLVLMVLSKLANAFSSRRFPCKKSFLAEQRKPKSRPFRIGKLRLSLLSDECDYDETLLRKNENIHGSSIKESVNSEGHLSKRGSSLPPLRDDLDVFEKGLNDPYHPIDNPEGYIVMLVAENKLLLSELNAKLSSIQQNSASLPDWTFGYGDFGGDETFRKVVAKNVIQRFSGGAVVDPSSLRFQAGAGSILNLLALCLGDPHDGVLVSGPIYPAFPADFEMIANTKLHICDTTAAQKYVPTIDQLEASYQAMVRANNPPKIFLLCQPNNPTGVVYTYEEMETMIDWALSKEGMHVVSDEIYALSVFPGVDFTSALKVMNDKQIEKEMDKLSSQNTDSSNDSEGNNNNNYLGDRVHIVYGLSKDWGMSGFRIGTLVSHNQNLLEAFGQLGYYSGVSQHTQHLLTELLSDNEWIDWYISENRKRLKDNYEALVKALEPIGVTIPVHAEGSHFCWADFSSFLNTQFTKEDLWLELASEGHKILLTTGTSCFEDKPGMFRIVHPWPEGGPLAMEELGRRLVKWKAKRDLQKQNEQ